MVKEILKYPNEKEKLTQISEPITEITDEIKELAQNLIDTLNNTKNGAGLSAVQIGIPKTMFAMRYNDHMYIIINPKITRERGEIKYREGCLSAGDIFAEVTRKQKVWCKYIDLEGKTQELAEGGLCSVIIQHEMDHFQGKCAVFTEVDTQAAIEKAKTDFAKQQGMEMSEGVPLKTKI